MPVSRAAPDAFAIERDLRAAAPELLFAPPRTVRRLLRRDRDVPLGWRAVPHRDIAILDAARLAAIAGDLIVVPADMPPRVAVIARPDAARLGRMAESAVLRDYWRLAFHALVDLAATQALAKNRLPVADRIGAETFAEAREVLTREGLSAADATDEEVAIEFTAVFLELRCFRPEAVAEWFPSLDQADDLAADLSAAIAAEALLERALPVGLDADALLIDPQSERASRIVWPGWLSWPRPRAAALRRRADRTAVTGNLVRAMLEEWTAATTRPSTARPAVGRLERLIDAFARRLAWSLDLDAADGDAAARLIRTLVERAAGSPWSPDARLLYDLQKVCVDSERESFRTQLWRWLGSAGRRPLAVPLPCQRLVLIHRHAEAAAARLPSLRLPPDDQIVGERLLGVAVETTAHAARETLRPTLERAVSEAGLRPQSLVEQVAAAKLVDELLDAIIERGFVSFGSVRDAVSRNQLKLRDLAGIREWLDGDELLRLDRRLAATLDGVYRQAPLYLALLQRLSSPFFGIAVGRLLTSHVLLPFGGAWILLRGLEHVVEPITEYSLGDVWHIYSRARVAAIGIAIWALIHLPRVRAAAWQIVRGLAAGVHVVVIDLPTRLLGLPVVARLVRSAPVRWFIRHAWSPLVVTAVAWAMLPYQGRWVSRSAGWFPPTMFVVSTVALNSPAGRHAQEQVVEAASRLLHHVHVHVIVGFVSWIVDAFRRAMDMVEGTLYAVDESLRFRSDESGLMLAVKALLGAVWSVVEAAVRFCITLLIEPQLNPIKHFPVVTVSHKLLVPMIPVVAAQLVATTGMERGLALTAVTFVSTALPGVFGFLAWELKENWRLYAANRSQTLRPVPVGHHGETVRRLLLPGFHSGTVPRLFARLRRAHDRAGGTSRTTKAIRQRHDLEHAVATFLERDVLAMVERSTAAGLGLVVEDVHLAVRRIRVVVQAGALPDSPPLILDLVRRDRVIESRVVAPGWVDRLDPSTARTIRLAIAGFHRLAAADEATADFADLPEDISGSSADRGLITVTPIPWDVWQDDWERERRHPAS